jgi:hypothetical protein
MKNFYDLADTSTLEVNVQLSVKSTSGFPNVLVSVNNNQLHNGLMHTALNLTSCIDVLDSLVLHITLSDCVYRERNTTVQIDSVTVDGFNVIPSFTYLTEYNNDSCQPIPTTTLEFNGTWTLDTVEPFLWWKHGVVGNGWLLHP